MPVIDYRPAWCPHPEHTCIPSRANALCMGLLPRAARHDALLDNLCFCMAQQDDGRESEAPEPIFMNLEDCILLKHLLEEVIAYGLQHKIYRPPGFGTEYGQAEARAAAQKEEK